MGARVRAGVWAGAGASLCPHVHKEVLPKRNLKNQKEQRTSTKRNAGSFGRYPASAETFWAVSSVGGIFWAISSVGGTVWAVSRVGGTLLAVLRFSGTFWRYRDLEVLFGGI